MIPPARENTKHTLARVIGKNTIFGIVANGTQVLTRLVTVPIVIRHLGLDGYGIWNVVMVTATYMRFGSVGIKTAFQKYVAEATGDGDYDRANALLSTGSAIMLVLSVLGLIPAILFSKQIAHFAGVPPLFLKSASIAIGLLAVIMLMANVGAAFEAIVMGGHRIDLARKFNTFFSIAEAAGIVAVLHFGFGLAAMAAVMGTSELVYLTCCFFAARRVVPQMRLGMQWVRRDAIYEIVRFAGSFQLVNILEVVYNSLVPIAVLRSFGADLAGIYAIVTRITGAASSLLDSFLPPILSGGTMVYAAGKLDEMKLLLSKAFKATLGLTLFPFGFIALMGPTIAYAWTGQHSLSFGPAFWLVCLRSVFAGFSMLALVLYRVSGRAILDNIRQAIRIAVILLVVSFASRLGFVGVLSGLALCECIGMVFMLYALARTFAAFRAGVILPGTIRLGTAVVLLCAAALAASHIPLPGVRPGRLAATLQLLVAGMTCLVVAWPLLLQTGSVTAGEKQALFHSLLPRFGR